MLRRAVRRLCEVADVTKTTTSSTVSVYAPVEKKVWAPARAWNEKPPVVVDDKNAPWEVPKTLHDHAAFIGLHHDRVILGQSGLQNLNTDDILPRAKLAYLLECRRHHPECGGRQDRFEQLHKSYAVVCEHVARYEGAEKEVFDPKDTSTQLMNNVVEAQVNREKMNMLIHVWLGISLILGSLFMAWLKLKQQLLEKPATAQHVVGDTLLPWWGNDEQYERSVKRLYLEEWRRARSTARRGETFQRGLSRESTTDEATRDRQDIEIFEVSSDKLAALRDKVLKKKA